MGDGSRPAFSIRRDRLGSRLAELARKLSDPSPANVALVREELNRLAQG